MGRDRSCNSGVAGRRWRVPRQRRAERAVVSGHDRSGSCVGHARPGECRFARAIRVAGVAEVEESPVRWRRRVERRRLVPAGATGVLLNVTAVGATAEGFVSIRPGDATGAPFDVEPELLGERDVAELRPGGAADHGCQRWADRHHLRRARCGRSDNGCVDRCHGVLRRGRAGGLAAGPAGPAGPPVLPVLLVPPVLPVRGTRRWSKVLPDASRRPTTGASLNRNTIGSPVAELRSGPEPAAGALELLTAPAPGLPDRHRTRTIAWCHRWEPAV